MAQMKAYTMPMKNLTLICVPEFLCRKVWKQLMWPELHCKWLCPVLCTEYVFQGINPDTLKNIALNPLKKSLKDFYLQCKEGDPSIDGDADYSKK